VWLSVEWGDPDMERKSRRLSSLQNPRHNVSWGDEKGIINSLYSLQILDAIQPQGSELNYAKNEKRQQPYFSFLITFKRASEMRIYFHFLASEERKLRLLILRN